MHCISFWYVSVWKNRSFEKDFVGFLVSGGGQSQTYSDLSSSSLHSSESLSSANNPYQQQSSITDLDETVKPTPMKQLHIAEEIVERYDEGVFEEDENNSVVVAESDDEDEIEHFDNSHQLLNEDFPTDHQSINLSTCSFPG